MSAGYDFNDDSIVNVPPTPRQTRLTLGAIAAFLVGLGILSPFAATQLPPVTAFIPFVNAAVFVTNLVTATLLFVHFSAYRSPALLALAGGYVFSGLIVIPHALTFPGAFSPTGLLNAGTQTTAWLYIFWHTGFSGALLVYVWLRGKDFAVRGSIRSAVTWCVALAILLVSSLVFLTTAGEPLLPRFFVDANRLTPLGRYAPSITLLFIAVAAASIWTHRRSVLDLWLTIVACALMSELALTATRFSLGFYFSRLMSLVTSSIILVIMIVQTVKLYSHVVQSNAIMRRERENKLMNMEAMAIAISHEVRQPLAAISMNSEATLALLERSAPAVPDLEEIRSALTDIIDDSHRTSEIFKTIRSLFVRPGQEKREVNINEIIFSILHMTRAELKRNDIGVATALAPELPLVMGHEGQLREVVINLVNNAVEAMAETKGRKRRLRIETERYGDSQVAVSVEDSGPGVDSNKINDIFNAFSSTKRTGMGLGLTICRMIVEQHGGRISASSSAMGGAVFKFILPTEVEAASTPSPLDDTPDKTMPLMSVVGR